jgi:tetratricopeptide (TPR) repeat protein
VVLPEEKARIERPPTGNAEAYDLYLRARVLFSNTSNSPELVQQVNALLGEAVRLDPAFIEAWADLARYNAVFYADRRADPTPERLAAAERALARAEAIDPAAAATLKARGAIALFARKDAAAAARDFALVVDQVPNDADAWTWLGMAQSEAGDPVRSVTSFERALRLDPNSFEAGVSLVSNLRLLRRNDEAWLLYQRLKRTFPHIVHVVPEVFLRFGADQDFAGFRERLKNSPFASDPAIAPEWALIVAYFHGDTAAFMVPGESDPGGVTPLANLPTPHRLIAALGHFLADDPEAARREAAAAREYLGAEFREQHGATVAEINLATAHALLGETDEALAHLENLAAHPPPNLNRLDTGRAVVLRVFVLGLVGRRDAALDLLHDTLQGPFVYPPGTMRFDPLLARVFGDDPRFLEILATAPRL